MRRHGTTPSLSTFQVDLLVALVVAVPTALDAWWNEVGTRQADWDTYGLLVVSIGALLFRRRWPLPVTAVCGAAFTGWYVLGHHGELLNLPTMVALYTVAVQGDRRTSVVVGAVAAAWAGTLGFLSDDPAGARGGAPVLEMIWPLVPLALGEAVRARRELTAEYAEGARRDAEERERQARERIEAERLRIAREIHDVVAHTMAAVNVQMGVAVAAFDSHPEKARRALAEARASSRAAVQELSAAIEILRYASTTGPIAPAPTIAQLEDLADTARAAGVAVSVRNGIEDCDLSAAVELAAYRIVQEALTNVIRHADARHVTVSLRLEDHRLVVEVADDGRARETVAAAPLGTGNGGYGLVGMAERATALGGSVEHGPNGSAGWRVRAVIPVQALRP